MTGHFYSKAASILLFACFAFTPAEANDEMTNGELYSLCTSADQNASAACRFYILGVVQGIELGDGAYMGANRQLAERKKTILCLTESTPQAQMVSIVKDAMKAVLAAYPGDRDLPATSSILAAMARKFPCPR
jgi:hypothetical protein